MRYYIIAGEASGDLHGSRLIRALKNQDHSADIRCWGGDLMEAAGGTLVKHYRDLAFMGFVEVLANLRTIFRNLAACKSDILLYRPDCLILIDYPGFNLRIARWARAQGIKVVYYISPQVWAWKENRVKMMKQCINLMLVILPFEKEYYKNKWNWEVQYVGHPLVEIIDEFRSEGRPLELSARAQAQPGPLIALLPGSRRQEILKKLPVMLQQSLHFPGYRFVVARAPGLDEAFYEPLLSAYPNVFSVSGQTYALLNSATAALVTSGTATLETALFGVPEIVCYKGNPLSYIIARQVIKVKYISLVNLIMDRLVVKELIQQDLTEEKLKKELQSLLEDSERKKKLHVDYALLREKLGQGGKASAQAAAAIQQFLGN